MDKNFPGAELIHKGVKDASCNEWTREALLVAIAYEHLLFLGAVPELEVAVPHDAELLLYRLLLKTEKKAAYRTYNSLRRRLVSFCRALEREHGAKVRG